MNTPKTAKAAYKKEQARIKKLIAKIEKGLEADAKDFAKKSSRWDYVGSLQHYANLLQEISDSVNNEGEYAN